VTGVFMSLLFVHIILPPPLKIKNKKKQFSEEEYPILKDKKVNLLFYTEKNPSEDDESSKKYLENSYSFINSMDALTQGTLSGVNTAVAIGAAVLVSMSLVAFCNSILIYIPSESPMTLERILGLCMSPLAWCMGISQTEILASGGILGTKIIMNELAAMVAMTHQTQLSEFSCIELTYGICAFGNISSISIQIAGLGYMIPERKDDIIELARDALLTSTLVSCTTGAVVGLWLRLEEIIKYI
jgi:CNT family concentrative nucleoside transporter